MEKYILSISPIIYEFTTKSYTIQPIKISLNKEFIVNKSELLKGFCVNKNNNKIFIKPESIDIIENDDKIALTIKPTFAEIIS